MAEISEDGVSKAILTVHVEHIVSKNEDSRAPDDNFAKMCQNYKPQNLNMKFMYFGGQQNLEIFVLNLPARILKFF